MPLVFAGVCSHAPGIVNRAERADPAVREPFYKAFRDMGDAIRASGAEALMVIAAEHFGNFFMENMPAFAIGMADHYEGPIEDPDWMKIERRQIPGDKDLSLRLIKGVMQEVDVAFAEEWKFDHGIMVPLNFLTPKYDMPIIPANVNCQGPPLTPLHRAYAFGQAIRHAADALPEKIALVGTGGISHWPATPDSGKINEAWDRAFLDKFLENRKDELLAYSDRATYADAGQGAFEIRTFIAVAGAAEGHKGKLWFYEPIPIFAVGCTVATMEVA